MEWVQGYLDCVSLCIIMQVVFTTLMIHDTYVSLLVNKFNLFYKVVGAVVFIVLFPGNMGVFFFSYTTCVHSMYTARVIIGFH